MFNFKLRLTFICWQDMARQ